MSLLAPYYRWGHWDLLGFCHVPKVMSRQSSWGETHPVSGPRALKGLWPHHVRRALCFILFGLVFEIQALEWSFQTCLPYLPLPWKGNSLNLNHFIVLFKTILWQHSSSSNSEYLPWIKYSSLVFKFCLS